MYNALFGYNELANKLLEILDLSKEDFGRFRDCYLSEDKKRIIVYTRCGGGNREYYQEIFDKMEQHPLYLTDYDDDFDSTYASIEFKLPDKYISTFEKMEVDTMTGEEKFKKFLEMLEKSE